MNVRTLPFPTRSLFSLSAVAALSLAMFLATGCKKNSAVPNDAALSSQANNRLQADQNLARQAIEASVVNGVATLNGSVTSPAARELASQDVAQISGVRTVVDNLIVATPEPVAPAVAQQQPPTAPQVDHADRERERERQHEAERERRDHSRTPPTNLAQQTAPPPPPAPIERIAPPPQPQQAPPPPAPAPVIHNLTLATGTTIPVRITQTLDSATSQTGDDFTGSIAADVIEDGIVALREGTPVTGRVVEAHDATHFKGNSLLTISLTSINRHGNRINVTADDYSKEGQGRGKNTAKKIGGGAAIGAILGGIFGGGRGAAIGAAAGGGLGAGAQAATRGQQVQIPSESVVRFRLTNPILVRVTTEPGSNPHPGLEHRNNNQ